MNLEITRIALAGKLASAKAYGELATLAEQAGNARQAAVSRDLSTRRKLEADAIVAARRALSPLTLEAEDARANRTLHHQAPLVVASRDHGGNRL